MRAQNERRPASGSVNDSLPAKGEQEVAEAVVPGRQRARHVKTRLSFISGYRLDHGQWGNGEQH